jgi:CheY-like chemotaxis protein
MLSEAGHQVVTSPSAQSALKLLAEETVDAIITDIEMPGMDGLEFIRVVRRSFPHTPVIAMSGAPWGSTLLSLGKQGGAYSSLRKPLSQSEVVRKVAAAIEASRHAKDHQDPLDNPHR